MKNYIKKYGVLATCLFILTVFAAQYVTAGVYFIEKNDEPGGTQLGRCVDRGYTKTETCNDPYKKGETCAQNTRYHKGCVCMPDYKFTKKQCEDKGLSPKGTPCRENNVDKYKECDCGTDYKYDEDNCKSPMILSKAEADMCGGKSKVCSCPSEYKHKCNGPLQKGIGTKCGDNYKECGCDGTKCDNGGAAGAKECKVGDVSYWSSCKQITCESEGYVSESNIKSGETCDYVKTLSSTRCYNNCGETCSKAGYINSQTFWGGKLGHFMNLNDSKYKSSSLPNHCIKLASCEEFGFTVDTCGAERKIKCPFDQSKTYCKNGAKKEEPLADCSAKIGEYYSSQSSPIEGYIMKAEGISATECKVDIYNEFPVDNKSSIAEVCQGYSQGSIPISSSEASDFISKYAPLDYIQYGGCSSGGTAYIRGNIYSTTDYTNCYADNNFEWCNLTTMEPYCAAAVAWWCGGDGSGTDGNDYVKYSNVKCEERGHSTFCANFGLIIKN